MRIDVEGPIKVNKIPFINGLKFNVDGTKARIKVTYLENDSQMDLDFSYDDYSFNLKGVKFEFTVLERLRNIRFDFQLSINLALKFHLKGLFNGKRIDTDISGPLMILAIIKDCV